jgi:NIMA (never in mitosis gene a)-related kinase 1/4/5
MQGLATKVTRGIYDPLPSIFSADLQSVIKSCLQVDPKKRPSCQQILELPGLKKNISSSISQN